MIAIALVSVINPYYIDRLHLFWDTLYYICIYFWYICDAIRSSDTEYTYHIFCLFKYFWAVLYTRDCFFTEAITALLSGKCSYSQCFPSPTCADDQALLCTCRCKHIHRCNIYEGRSKSSKTQQERRAIAEYVYFGNTLSLEKLIQISVLISKQVRTIRRWDVCDNSKNG